MKSKLIRLLYVLEGNVAKNLIKNKIVIKIIQKIMLIEINKFF